MKSLHYDLGHTMLYRFQMPHEEDISKKTYIVQMIGSKIEEKNSLKSYYALLNQQLTRIDYFITTSWTKLVFLDSFWSKRSSYEFKIFLLLFDIFLEQNMWVFFQ